MILFYISSFIEFKLTNAGAHRMISAMNLVDAAARLEALGNSTRLSIYRLLVKAGDGGVPVGRIQSQLDLAASTLSHHLKALVIVGLVRQERSGTVLFCQANYPTMRGLVEFLVAECCTEACRPQSTETQRTEPA
jgi:ArsR family transcriptional regulator, arsenate/arsenite/antimonite-responsive transcriptional repressor